MKDLDLNVIIPAVLALVTWLWRSRSADKQASLRDQLDAVITAAVHRIADNPELRERARILLRAEALGLVARLGLKPAAFEPLIDLAIDEGLAELAQLLESRRLAMTDATAALAAGAQGAVDAFDVPTNPLVPPIDPNLVSFEPMDDAAPAAAAKVRAAIEKTKG